MKHVFGAYNSDIDHRDDPFHPFTPGEWSQQTSTMLRTYIIQILPDPYGPDPVPSGPISSSRPTGYSPAAIELMGFDRIPSTTPGAEPPRDAKDSGSARSHSTHLETSSSNRP